MTTDQPLDLDAIETRANAATPGPWFVHKDWPGRVFAESEFNAHVARVTGSNPEPNEQFIAHAREDVDRLVAEVRRLHAELEEMTRLRDNALRALYRGDVEVDIDLEETIAAPFYGPGWDWDEGALQPVVREAAGAVRPAFGKLTQQRDEALAALAAIRHLHKDSPMGPCPVCIDADAIAEGRDGLMPYPCPTGRLAGAQDCEPTAPAARSADV